MGNLLSILKYVNEVFEEGNGEKLKHNAADHHKYQTISVPNTKITSANQNTLKNVNSMAGKQRAEEAVTTSIKCNVRWIKHYSSCHRILVVGDGDFSFSSCLASAFAFLVKNYPNALSNLVELGIRGCQVMHEIDATKMCNHPYLGGIKFNRIVFNFPFAGFFNDVSRDCVLGHHRELVSQFLKNAKEMISDQLNGEIHITHKTNGFHMEWKVESIASSHKLRLVEAVDFNHLEYPGYNTKYGFGGDGNFNCYPSKTYKFGL